MSQTKAQLIDNLVQPITGALGSASAPTFSFTSDPNTGLYSPGADQLALTTGGTGRLFIDSSGRVCVGATPTAGSPFQVQTAKATINLISTTGTNSAYATFTNTGANFYVGIDSSTSEFAAPYAGVVWQGGAYPLLFGTSNLERMRLDSSGRLGVGSSVPTSALTVAGDVAVGGTGNIGVRFHSASPTAASLRWLLANDQGNSNKLTLYRYDSGGNFAAQVLVVDTSNRVGIGVSTPGDSLEVNGNGLFYGNTGSQNGIFVGSNSSYNWSIQRENVATGDLYFGNVSGGSRTTRMTLTDAGRLGIGTTSPASPFQVRVGTNQNIAINSDGSNARLSCFNDAASASVPLVINGSDIRFTTEGTERARINSSGNLCIGRTDGSNSISLVGNIAYRSSEQNTTNDSYGTRLRSIAHQYTNLSTSAVAMTARLGSNGFMAFVSLQNVDTDQGTCIITMGREDAIAHRYSFVTGSNANCNVTEVSEGVFEMSGLGDGRTYTITFNTGSANDPVTLKASSSTTGTTILVISVLQTFI